jgi:hypothetical protein
MKQAEISIYKPRNTEIARNQEKLGRGNELSAPGEHVLLPAP